MHVVVVGAGPSGLAAALALHQQSSASSPIRVTILELRPKLETIGGAVNLTPLAMRYIDALGAGARLRPRGIKVGNIEIISHRTGATLGKLWPDADALRVKRYDVSLSLLETIQALPDNNVSLRFGVRVQAIEETGSTDSSQGGVRVRLTDLSGDNEEALEADVVLGCDGIHSFVRSQYVEPERKKEFSGCATAYGYITLPEPDQTILRKPDGEPAVIDTTLVSARNGSLLFSYCEASRTDLYVAAVVSEKEKEDARNGWKAVGADMDALKKDLASKFVGGKIQGLDAAVAMCESWFFFPVYMLPAGGKWTKGRVLLLGDAAHAVSISRPPIPPFPHPPILPSSQFPH